MTGAEITRKLQAWSKGDRRALADFSPFLVANLADAEIEQLLAIDEVLDALGREHPRRRRIFEMRFFAGLSVEELAQALHLSENTVIRDYRLACAWLRFHLFGGASSGGA